MDNNRNSADIFCVSADIYTYIYIHMNMSVYEHIHIIFEVNKVCLCFLLGGMYNKFQGSGLCGLKLMTKIF